MNMTNDLYENFRCHFYNFIYNVEGKETITKYKNQTVLVWCHQQGSDNDNMLKDVQKHIKNIFGSYNVIIGFLA